MFCELKDVFKTKRGLLIVLSMITIAISAYLNLITVKNVLIGNFSISFGTLFLSFIPMITSELMAECYGWKKGFVISSLAYTVCLLFTLILWGSTFIPGLVFVGPDAMFATDAYNLLFAASPLILLASAVAYYVGIFFNCYIMGKLKDSAEKHGDSKGKLFGRFALSTLVGQTMDNAIFFMIPAIFMTWGATWYDNWTYVWQQTTAALGFEVLYEVVFFFLTAYLVKKINGMPEGLNIVVDKETREVVEIID
jgi:uncharacterized integral membrane protein (TIGR00697 family)